MNQPICPECGGKVIYARLKTRSYVCRRCAYVWTQTSQDTRQTSEQLGSRQRTSQASFEVE